MQLFFYTFLLLGPARSSMRERGVLLYRHGFLLTGGWVLLYRHGAPPSYLNLQKTSSAKSYEANCEGKVSLLFRVKGSTCIRYIIRNAHCVTFTCTDCTQCACIIDGHWAPQVPFFRSSSVSFKYCVNGTSTINFNICKFFLPFLLF